MTIYHKGEAWPEERYVEPTKSQKRDRHAELQARCPYDLNEVAEWTQRMWIDWGYELWESTPPQTRSNIEHHAMLRACENFTAVQRWCREFMKYVQVRRKLNGYVDDTAE